MLLITLGDDGKPQVHASSSPRKPNLKCQGPKTMNKMKPSSWSSQCPLGLGSSMRTYVFLLIAGAPALS